MNCVDRLLDRSNRRLTAPVFLLQNMIRRLYGRDHQELTILLNLLITTSDIQVVSRLQEAVSEVALSEICCINIGTHHGGSRVMGNETEGDRNMATVYFNEE